MAHGPLQCGEFVPDGCKTVPGQLALRNVVAGALGGEAGGLRLEEG